MQLRQHEKNSFAAGSTTNVHLSRNPGNKTYAEAVRHVTAQSKVFSQTEKKRQRSKQKDDYETTEKKGQNDEQD